MDTVELLADIDNNIDSSVGKDHIQDTADSTAGIAAGTVAVADTTVLQLVWQIVQLVVAQLNWLPDWHLDQIQAEQKLVKPELEKQVILTEMQSGFDLQQLQHQWMHYPEHFLVVAPEIALQDSFVHVPAPGGAQSEHHIYCKELATPQMNM